MCIWSGSRGLTAAFNAFRVVFAERARMEADQADARRGAGNERPLLGVPIAVKDERTSPAR